MTATIDVVSRNPAFSPYAIDEPFPLEAKKGITNPGYENCNAEQDPSHHYENPSNLKTSTVPRQKSNQLYESVDPHQNHSAAKYQEQKEHPVYKESRLNSVILFVILVISIVALLLVVLIILGKLGPSCSCSSGGKVSGLSGSTTGAQVSIDPLYTEMEKLRQNFSLLTTRMNRQDQEISSSQSELNAVKSQLQALQVNTNAETVQKVWLLANTTKDSLAVTDENTRNMYTQVNTTHDELFAALRVVTSNLQLVNSTITNKLTMTADQLVTAGIRHSSELQVVNSTLIAKINAVTKMEGPRGYNGSQGAKGDQGAAGAAGSDGAAGARGITGPTGVQGPTGQQGLKGRDGLDGLDGKQGIPGAGNLTQCEVKILPSSGTTAGSNAVQSIHVLEDTGKKILQFSCSSNKADTLEQAKQVGGDGKITYACTCSGQGSNSAVGTMYCYITYTECPLIS